MAFTPGPWMIEQDRIVAHGKRVIAFPAFTDAQAQDNATLLASAPDLLAACERVEAEAGHAEDCWQRDNGASECSCYRAAVSAAIESAS